MAIKKSNKVSAEFSMSSMTDIVFLLLIFFLLTSTVVAPNALKLVLPKHSDQTLAKRTLFVNIEEDFTYSIVYPEKNPPEIVNREDLPQILKSKLASYPKYEATIVIQADEEIPIKDITYVMSIGNKIKQKVILATEPE